MGNVAVGKHGKSHVIQITKELIGCIVNILALIGWGTLRTFHEPVADLIKNRAKVKTRLLYEATVQTKEFLC